MSAPSLSSPRLRSLARRSAAGAGVGADGEDEERCELCGNALAADHRHVLELDTRRLLCACRPCALLFDRPAAAHGRLRLVGEQRWRLEGFVLSDSTWAQLNIPVDMAYFVRGSAERPGDGVGGSSAPGAELGPGRTYAFYPSPLGPTESALELSAWTELEAANPALAQMACDVEALLINRTARHPGQWLVPITDCFALVALIRTGWRGFSGGPEVWEKLERFFADLDRGAARRASEAVQRGTSPRPLEAVQRGTSLHTPDQP